MKKPKILIIGTTDNKGGAAQVSWNLFNGLKKKKYWTRKIVGYKYSDSKHVYQLNNPLGKKATLLLRHFRSYVLANDQDFGLDKEIFKHIWYKQADIVHLQNTHGNYISLNAIKKISQEKKLIWTLHDMWPITSHCAYTKNAYKKYHKPLDCALDSYPPIMWDNRQHLWQKKINALKNLNIVYVPSSKWLEKKFKTTSLKNKPSFQIYNGVDVKIFKTKDKNKSRKKLRISLKQKIALYVAVGGKNNKRKGFKFLKELSTLYPNVVFMVIGGKRNHIEGNIQYIKRTSDKNKLSDFYNASDVLIFPSLADNNPQVVLEALSCKLPVLAFNVCGNTELITHKKNGYLSDYKNTNDFKKGFNYLLQYKPQDKDFLVDYSIEKMIKAHENLYKKLYD